MWERKKSKSRPSGSDQSCERNPFRSIIKMVKDMEIRRSSMERIVKDNLKLTCYRVRKAAILSEATTKKRLERSRKLLQRTCTGELLVTVFSDEKLFTTSDEAFGNGRTIHQASHPASVIVFGAVFADGKSPSLFVGQETLLPWTFVCVHPVALTAVVFTRPQSFGLLPLGIEALRKTLVKERDALSPDYLRATIDAYPRRLRAVIGKRGGPVEHD
ncbi:unnamed protein product [Caenorhabditis auriculariae]|uniref:Uncharacterized protein n=1 Tax=Caenorhabditis auriculariae TaxID=2777116 RepID=A0A8S1H210_9PELO|nr:unnamed protein product [Caenorhabditis auriculariae]